MDSLHQGAQHAFDRPTKMGLANWAVGQADAMLITATAERFTMKLGRIIDVDRAGFTPQRPFPLNLKPPELGFFVKHRMRQAKTDRDRRGRLQCEAKTR